MKKKPFNQSLFNLLTAIALIAITGYAVLLTWVVFDFQQSNATTTDSLGKQIFDLQK